MPETTPDIAALFAAAFRDFTVDGNPASGVYQPEKLLLRQLGEAIVEALAEKAGIDLASDVVRGLMSPQQVEKLAGIAENANKYAHPTADGSRHVPATGAGDTARFLKSADAAGGAPVWATLGKNDVGLDKVANTAPDKLPISDDVQAALDDKVDLSGEQTLTDKTLKLPVIDGYTEGHATASGISFSPDLAADTLFHYQTTGNATITLPAATAGKSFTVAITYGGAHGVAWAGAARKWPRGEVPTPTSAAGKIDVFSFICVIAGTWLAFPSGQEF